MLVSGFDPDTRALSVIKSISHVVSLSRVSLSLSLSLSLTISLGASPPNMAAPGTENQTNLVDWGNFDSNQHVLSLFSSSLCLSIRVE